MDAISSLTALADHGLMYCDNWMGVCDAKPAVAERIGSSDGSRRPELRRPALGAGPVK